MQSIINKIVDGDIENALKEYEYPVGFPDSIDIHLELAAKYPKVPIDVFNKLNKNWKKEIILNYDQLFDYVPYLNYTYLEKRAILNMTISIKSLRNMKKALEFYNEKELKKLLIYGRALEACKKGYYYNLNLLTVDDLKNIFRMMKVKQPSIKKKDEFIKKLIEDLDLKEFKKCEHTKKV